MAEDSTWEKAKGVAKEAVGKATGDERTVREAEAQQKKAQSREEAERLERKAGEKRREAALHRGEQKAHE